MNLSKSHLRLLKKLALSATNEKKASDASEVVANQQNIYSPISLSVKSMDMVIWLYSRLSVGAASG